ncbi:phosphotransferase [Telluribacter sp. SYSU D00476]|uniref:phosphotransferase n=1 Tax=Telluribacter sp. SYSU D00476 TaxID=2811430 RepID=UPI001FF1B4FC|nr:phosphotransferase [Telluribacter sp. SYSU D00476]
MQTYQIDQLRNWLARETTKPVDQLETHISWVLLTDSLAYKIKKPVRFPFLDFTDREVRHELCRRELALNQRLSPDIYLAVSPIVSKDGTVCIGTDGEVVDYAVVMKRLDDERLLNHQLAYGQVSVPFVQKLAQKLAAFHMASPPTHTPVNVEWKKDDFMEILEHSDWMAIHLGTEWQSRVQEWTRLTHWVIDHFAWRMKERMEQGFQRDGHGDLHSGNIFMYEEDPVIFDCLEYDETCRRIDVLNEIAFFCIDLDLYQQPQLRKAFMEAYNEQFQVMHTQEDVILFKYYCLHRACTRLKVEILKARTDAVHVDETSAADYVQLADTYADQLQTLLEHYITYERDVAGHAPVAGK